MSASADVLRGSAAIRSATEVAPAIEVESVRDQRWDPEDFGREQILGLVRRVFFGSGANSVKQVVFSAAELHLDVAGVCCQVARALALLTLSEVALVERQQNTEERPQGFRAHLQSPGSIKSEATRVSANLWRIAKDGLAGRGEGLRTGLDWPSCLADLRREFEYAVIHGPTAAVSSEAAGLAQITDGIILVVGAQSTKKAAARTIKASLDGAQARILGIVLSDRKFPMPEGIYRRL